MVKLFIIYLALIPIWYLAVLTYEKWIIPSYLSLRGKVKQASSNQIREQVRNLGVAIATGAFFGAFFGITAGTGLPEIIVRAALALIFVVIGVVVVILGLDKK